MFVSQFSGDSRSNLFDNKKMKKIDDLRKEVEHYIDIAKKKYGIEVQDIKFDNMKQREQFISHELRDELLSMQPDFKTFSTYEQNQQTVTYQPSISQVGNNSSQHFYGSMNDSKRLRAN